MSNPNVNAYWEYVKSVYPDAVFDFWYHTGELHFFANKEMEQRGCAYGCIKKDGEFAILSEAHAGLKTNRLTTWNGKKWVLPQGRWRDIAETLAAYENTGLTPEQINLMIVGCYDGFRKDPGEEES